MQERFEQHFKTLGLSFEARLSKHFGSVHLTHAVVGPLQIQQVDVAKHFPAHREHSGVAESRRQGNRIKVGQRIVVMDACPQQLGFRGVVIAVTVEGDMHRLTIKAANGEQTDVWSCQVEHL